MAKKDYYSVLGIRRDAAEKEIKQAYRRLARQYHPDVNPGDPSAEQKFKEISEAYAVLGNPEQRQKYDHFGHQAFGGGFDPFASSGGGGYAGFDNKSFRDVFSGKSPFGSGVGSIFEEFFGGQSRPQPPSRGRDVEQTVDITFAEAISGTTKILQFAQANGRTERVQVKIPPGVDTGSKVRLSGKGERGTHGGSPGDRYIVLSVHPHAYLVRQGQDILCDVPVTLTEAMLGARIEVPTVDGVITMTIPGGTQNGQRFRLRGKGAPTMHGGERGDQYVTVQVVLPQHLDARSQELLEEFTARNPLQPREHMRW